MPTEQEVIEKIDERISHYKNTAISGYENLSTGDRVHKLFPEILLAFGIAAELQKMKLYPSAFIPVISDPENPYAYIDRHISEVLMPRIGSFLKHRLQGKTVTEIGQAVIELAEPWEIPAEIAAGFGIALRSGFINYAKGEWLKLQENPRLQMEKARYIIEALRIAEVKDLTILAPGNSYAEISHTLGISSYKDTSVAF